MSARTGLLAGTIGRLRHPWLFAIAGVMLVTDLVIPDIVPFVDEILLAAATTGLALLRKRRVDKASDATAPEGEVEVEVEPESEPTP